MQTKSPTKPSAFYIDNYLAGFVHDPVSRGFSPKSPSAGLKDLGVTVKSEGQGAGEDDQEGKEEEDTIGDNGAVMVDIPRFASLNQCLSLLSPWDFVN